MPKTYPVTVTVTMDGKPTEKAFVNVYPVDAANKQWYASGVTNASGKATLKTYSEYDGVIAGDFVVVIQKERFDPIPNSPEYNVVQEIASQFGNIQATPLKMTVTAEGKNSFDFDVESSGK